MANDCGSANTLFTENTMWDIRAMGLVIVLILGSIFLWVEYACPNEGRHAKLLPAIGAGVIMIFTGKEPKNK